MTNTDETLQRAVASHQRGDFATAAALYEQVLSEDPEEIDALHLLGLVRAQERRFDEAIELIRKAIAVDESIAELHLSLGKVMLEAGRTAEAVTVLNRALALKPGLGQVRMALGAAYLAAGRAQEAKEHLLRAIAENDSDALAHHRLGLALMLLNDSEAALEHFRRAVALAANFAEARKHLGAALLRFDQVDAAVGELQEAAKLFAGDPEVFYNLGVALNKRQEFDAAAANYERAIALKPDYVEALNNLGQLHQQSGRFDRALELHRLAVAHRPDHVKAVCNLGTDYFGLGMVPEAIGTYRRALALAPDDWLTHCILALMLNYDGDADPETVFREHVAFGERHASKYYSEARPHTNGRQPERRLRVAYLSADFREHPVAFFLEPILENLYRREFEVICYSNGAWKDYATDRLRALSDGWRDVTGITDEKLVEQIQEDEIDILVDLAGLTGDNRLLALARKPAPVQVTHFSYPNTTGVRTIDYRMTDPYADPPGKTEQWSVEKLWRLPEVAWCWRPVGETPDIGDSPAKRNGFVTFASLNNPSKVTRHALDAWARILAQTPDSKLVMLMPQATQERVREVFRARGVSDDRVAMAARMDRKKYLDLHNELDIYLDPFPYNGGVTSCDAMWMGVPLVTLEGQTYVSRQGVSLLKNLELEELIGADEDQYVKVAVELARDIARLAEVRATLRQRLASSPVMNHGKFATNLGNAYRAMWREWCSL